MSAPFWRPGEALAPLAELLDRGGILAIPTGSSYGLGVDPGNRAGVAAVFRIKGRRPEQALPIVISHLHQLIPLGVDPDGAAIRWAARHWPAPLSVVVPAAPTLAAAASDGSLAVRMPAAPALRALLGGLDRALTATSANPSGAAPLLDPAEVAGWLAGEDAVVVDGGRLAGGPPSTLVAFDAGGGIQIIRRGRFPVQSLMEEGP